nr:hypothetical protein [Anaerolineae bacterium]
MGFYRGIAIYLYPTPREDQIPPLELDLIALDIVADDQRLDQLRALGVLGDQPRPRRLVDEEGLIEACLDAKSY